LARIARTEAVTTRQVQSDAGSDRKDASWDELAGRTERPSW
jgi:hypothetical protein